MVKGNIKYTPCSLS